MNKTDIEWCDMTWNPVTGCLHGCEYCYARRIAERFGGFEPRCGGEDVPEDKRKYGKNLCGITTNGEPLHIFSKQPMRRTATGAFQKASFPYDFDPTFYRYRLEEPMLKKKPQTIFVCSMADLFGDWVPDEWIEEVFTACEKAPQHRYIFLTKNPKRYGELAKAGKLPQWDNMWYGSTLDSMKARRYQGRILDNTFVSIEPLTERMDVGLGSFGGDRWVIIGAETGNRAGKVTPEKEWVDTICAAADITHAAVFMKDSLIPIVGEENMRRELPWETDKSRGRR